MVSFFALDKVSGKKIWELKLKKGIASQPKIFRGLVAFGASQGSFTLVDANEGKKLGHYDPGRGVTGTPYIDEKTGDAYFISAAANLFALKIDWEKQLPKWPWE